MSWHFFLIAYFAFAMTCNLLAKPDNILPNSFVSSASIATLPPKVSVEEVVSGKYNQQFEPITSLALSLKYVPNRDRWIRIDLNDNQNSSLALQISSFGLDIIDMYSVQGDSTLKQSSGLLTNMSSLFPIFEIQPHQSQNQIYLNIYDNVRVPIHIDNFPVLIHHQLTRFGILTFIFSVAFTAFLASVIFCIIRREAINFYFMIFSFSTLLFLWLNTSFSKIYSIDIYRSLGINNVEGVYFTLIFEQIAGLLFINRYLNLKLYTSIFNHLSKILVVVFCSYLIFSASAEIFAPALTIALVVAYLIFISTMFAYGLYKNVSNAKKGVLSWAFYIGGSIYYSIFGYEENAIFVLFSCFAIEIMIFTAINAYNQYTESQRNYESKTHMFAQLKKLIRKSQLEKIEAGEILENTMPTKSSFAVIIAFDIQNSTNIGHGLHEHFFKDVIERCHSEMMDRDDFQAYMVKELGDGFLCSVGFPIPTESNVYDSSYRLALAFVEIFKESVKSYFGDKQYFCSIGIACGRVKGLFPKVGIKTYDLYGDPLVLATRYEAFRKKLFEGKNSACNIITVQDKVFQNLSPHLKHDFRKFTLEKFHIRDDASAKQLFYREIRPVDDKQDSLSA